jgi:uncharacterized repeat protein (TIGR03943 family)
VNRDAQDHLTALVGATMLAVGMSDLHLRYVKPAMQPLVVLSGVVLLAFALRGFLRIYREVVTRRHVAQDAAPAHCGGPETEDSHGHHPPTRTAWLLTLPLLVLYLVAPPSLGAFAAARSDTTIAEPTMALEPVPAPVDLTLTDYYSRVLYDPQSVAGARVRLTGFVTPVDGRWFVTRMVLACCAADGRPVKVLTTGAAANPAPPPDTWVEVVGRYSAPETLPDAEGAVATVEVDQVRIVDQPRVAYE